MKNIVMVTLVLFLILICSGTAMAADLNTSKPNSTVKLVFIHHSCGSNWLADGNGNLGHNLNLNNYYVTETDYGWDAEPGDNLGDRTNTEDWPSWFNNQKMPYVYANNYHSAYSNNIANPGGENQIIMFKSCYPLSEVGNSIDDEKNIYNSLLPYFAAHQNKLFVLITPPGETKVESYIKTRELSNWLVDTNNGWLKNYSGKNVCVFDFYGVLSETGSHHRVVADHVEHVYASNYDGVSPYHNGDDHPNSVGNQKATTEFLPLLNYAYNVWKNSQGPTITGSDPANNAVNVPLAKVITVNFNKDIKAGNNNIELKSSTGTIIPITISILGSVLTINHSGDFVSGTKYSLIFHTGCLTDLDGNLMKSTIRYFSTPPTVVSVNPADRSVNVPSNKVIKVTFSSTVQKSGNFWVELKSGGSIIPITKSLNGNVLTVTPKSALPEKAYRLILHTGCVTDLENHPLKLFVTTFSVGSSPYIKSGNPSKNAVNVPRNKVITLTMNEAIKKSSKCWIELKSSTSKIALTASVSGNKLILKHASLLKAHTKYILILHTGCVTDLAGNPLKLVARTFTTGSG